jgi:hypothetical protein
LILPVFPKILDEFDGQSIRLLYRGSQDGFSSDDFHRCCDNISDTLTIILTTNGSIFGGFSSIAWSSSGASKYDSTGRSFMFSIRNPSRYPPQKFTLKSPSSASIYCFSLMGPAFGNGICDFYVGNPLNGPNSGHTNIGYCYTNNTGIAGKSFLDGSHTFTVKDLEVFAIEG